MLERIARTPIALVATHLPVCIDRDTTVIEAVIALKRSRKGAIVVQDADGKAVGLFTERNALQRLAPGLTEWHLDPVSSVMWPAEVCAHHDTTVADAIERMNAHGTRHLPVVDDGGRPIGIISCRDLLAYLAEHFPRAFINLPPRQGARAADRR